jgi:phage gp29-like protein
MDRELRLLTPASMIEGEPVPDRKFVVFTWGDSDNPYGRGLGQKLWWPVWFKKNGVKFWLVFLEKFGMPTVKGKYPPGTSPEAQQALMDAIEAIQSDTGVKIPDSMDIEFLEASRAGSVSHEQLCQYMDRQISKAVLGQTASTEGTAGKLGNEDVQGDVRQEIVEADADLLDGCLNNTLIRWIVDYNFPGVAAYPKIATYAAAKPNVKEQSETDKTLVVDIGLPVSASYFYAKYNIPQPLEGEELVRPRLQNAISSPGEKSKAFSESSSAFTPDQQAIEALADKSITSISEALTANEHAIVAAVQSATSYEDAMQKALELYPALTMDALALELERANLNAEMFGRYAVSKETR